MKKNKQMNKTKALLFLLATGSTLALSGCGKEEKTPEDFAYESTEGIATEASNGNEITTYEDGPFVEIEGSRVLKYKNVVMNMKPYIDTNEIWKKCGHEEHVYNQYDYAYYDYDQDGENEVILYLRYQENDEDYLDLALLDYVDDQIIVKSCFPKDLKNSTILLVYKYTEEDADGNKVEKECLANYTWDPNNIDDSAIKRLDYSNETGAYETLKPYSKLVVDLEKEGMYPTPLYQYTGATYCDTSAFLDEEE